MFQRGHWNDMLIAEIKKRPILYSKESQNHFDRNAKNEMWEEVFEIVEPNWSDLNEEQKYIKGREIKGKWQNLRTSFKRALNDIEKGISKGRQYVYFDRLQFLLDEDNGQEKEDDVYTLPMNEKPQNFDETSIQSAQCSEQKQESENTSLMGSIDSVDELEFANVTTTEEIDEDKHFLLSLVPSFKRMTSQEKISTKIKILSIIGDVQNGSIPSGTQRLQETKRGRRCTINSIKRLKNY